MKFVKKDLDRDFYFLSTNNELDNRTIYPRIPKRRMAYENCDTRRICVSPDNIEGALKALPLYVGITLTVYKVNKFPTTRIVKPESKDVLDASATKERWCLNKVKLEKVGMIRINGFSFKWVRKKSPFCFTPKYLSIQVYNNVKYKWIDEYPNPCSVPDTYNQKKK